MKRQEFCDYCGGVIDLGREFEYQLEAADVEETFGMSPASLPTAYLPVRICKHCQESVDENERNLAEEDERERDRVRRMSRAILIGFAIPTIWAAAQLLRLLL